MFDLRLALKKLVKENNNKENYFEFGQVQNIVFLWRNSLYMGLGNAWGVHLPCKQEFSGVRIPVDPPYYKIILGRSLLWEKLDLLVILILITKI